LVLPIRKLVILLFPKHQPLWLGWESSTRLVWKERQTAGTAASEGDGEDGFPISLMVPSPFASPASTPHGQDPAASRAGPRLLQQSTD